VLNGVAGASLSDEKIGETVHLALGRSYPENVSALRWDLICDLRPRGKALGRRRDDPGERGLRLAVGAEHSLTSPGRCVGSPRQRCADVVR